MPNETLFLHEANNLLKSASSVTPLPAADSDFPIANLSDSKTSKAFKFGSAGLDSYVTINHGSAKSTDFCSIHGHNLDTGVTNVRLRSKASSFTASATDGTLEATFTVMTPAFYVHLAAPVSRQYWRVVFEGTNGSAIKNCEMVLGLAETFSTQFGVKFPYGILHNRPRVVNRLASGDRRIVNRTSQRNRTLRVDFGVSRTEYETARDDLMEVSEDGALPLVFVPDNSKPEVVFGKVNPDGDWTADRISDLVYEFQLPFVESPFDARVQ